MDRRPKSALSVVETAALLGISRNLWYELVRRKKIPAIPFGRRLLVPKKALDDLLTIGTPLGQREESVDIRCPESASGWVTLSAEVAQVVEQRTENPSRRVTASQSTLSCDPPRF